jgi:hypothetical protein
MKRLEIIPSTKEHVAVFFNETLRQSFKGITAILDGKVIGIAGLKFDGKRIVLFSDIRDDVRQYKRDIVKVIYMLYGIIKEARYPILALANPNEYLSERILIKMGFKYSGYETPDGKAFWRIP